MSIPDGRIALSPMAAHFARFIESLEPGAGKEVGLAAALVSAEVERSNVCAFIPAFAGTPVAEVLPFGGEDRFPQLEEWLAALNAANVVGGPGEFAPLILDDSGRLYLHRYYCYERAVADMLIDRAKRALPTEGKVSRLLSRYFPPVEEEPDFQRVAALSAATRSLAVISGGPGTGKTTTVVKIIALLQELSGDKPLAVALCAPTGKAAARLKEAVESARGALPVSDEVISRVPSEVHTIHRLLGAGSRGFRYKEGNPLPYDLIVVDESSMVDLPLMAALSAALSEETRLILLGDRDQLSSVEAGAVLGEISGGGLAEKFSGAFSELAGEAGMDIQGEKIFSPLADSVVILKKSYRFNAGGGIGLLADAVRRGDAGKALQTLKSGDPELSFGASEGLEFQWELARIAVAQGGEYLRLAAEGAPPEVVLESFGRLGILSSVRRGPLGVEGLNAAVEEALGAHGLINHEEEWYHGRPVMVTANDYDLSLFNGDIGVTLKDPSTGRLRVWFPATGGAARAFSPFTLPAHETVFAMTVHKSQGSEFETVLLALPAASEGRGITRELLYTALTRARNRLIVRASEESVRRGVLSPTERNSGLGDMLWS
ncbi:MAG: exodeoxyribonuclease V subunit alpha [Deltaproteobacteria bacterium]|nr:MAG: exodeoxyribonuclease V subunit alpha [Deltaproteobacteria bacterium]